mgnify:CR=1 FL=1
MPLFTLISNAGLLPDFNADADVWLLFGVKLMFILAGLVYVLFAILVTRQITIMSSAVTTTASPLIKLLGYFHLLVSILVLIYFFIVL